MLEVWKALPPEFKFDNPEQEITLWRGDKVGKVATGINTSLTILDPHQVMLETVHSGHDALIKLVDRHTGSSANSPLLSATTDLRMAQLFAQRPSETIYELSLPAHRLLRDPYNIGSGSWPKDSEVFVMGSILPEDIVAFKVNNSDQGLASELNYERDGWSYQADGLTDFSSLPKQQSPNPNGVWQGAIANSSER